MDNSLKRSTPHTESSVGEPPATRVDTRLKPNMPLETAANVLDDATHTRLDKALLAEFHVRGLPYGIWGAFALLSSVALNSEGCIDPKYANAAAMSFIERNPDLEVELWKAWEAKSFKHIRNLSTLPQLSTYNRINTKCRNSSSSTNRNNSHRCGISPTRERFAS